MNTANLKKALHKKIDSIDNKALLQAIHTLLEVQTEKVEYELSDEQVAELDKRLILHDSGEMKYYTMEQVRKKIAGKKKK